MLYVAKGMCPQHGLYSIAVLIKGEIHHISPRLLGDIEHYIEAHRICTTFLTITKPCMVCTGTA